MRLKAEATEPIGLKVEHVRTVTMGTAYDYRGLENKPKINGVELLGDVTFEKLGISPIKLSELAEMFKDW